MASSAYASSLGLGATASSLSLAFLNGASVVGRLSMGTLSDRYSTWLLASGTLVFTSLATYVLWGVLSYALPGVLAYGIIYGCLAGGWTSLWTGFVRPIASTSPESSYVPTTNRAQRTTQLPQRRFLAS